jgi:hypothetical protein
MKSKTCSLLACFVVMCSLSVALSGCSEPDNPPPAKPTETPPPATAKETQPHEMPTGKTYGASEKYKQLMKKPGP